MADLSTGVQALAGLERVLGLVSSKWAVPILVALDGRSLRRKQLKRALRGINDDRLDSTLQRHLRFGLVRRAWIDGPRSQEPGYALTSLGRSLLEELGQLDSWHHDNARVLDANAVIWDESHPEL